MNVEREERYKSIHTVESRRGFLSKSLASIAAFGISATKPQPVHASGFFTWQPPTRTLMPYQDFKTMLSRDEISQVEFGIDGRSLVCVDTNGYYHTLEDMPDDPPLLKELYQRGVTVSLQEMKFEKKMNAVNWFRDLVGVGDDLTEEEMYEYRGYKTQRQNIPERAYVPANLITGYDLSRNMRR